uniref:ATP synthase complex subunit 8 n=1 Tax=Luciola unmunsana TaxID=190477 RepID=A0A7L7SJM3_9COLE|nr:ATP synthase F0 subunit 8 [Luciola unmunsana]YP_010538697.1 ATP synthase F0 subunit 8 [Luciola parvula]QNZ92070.1 ATP synthase F0 subunit 8 [Luciola unmunsana]UYE92308.1 ATP synthase F0 subunit 8 [Luciola parvula]
MPQMAPLNWLNLFIFFLMVYMLFNTMNYFSFIYKEKELKQNKNIKLFTWKW